MSDKYVLGVTITNIEPGQSLLKDDSNGSQESAMDDVKIEPIERVDTSVFPITQPVIDLESKDPLGDIPCFDNAADFVAATCHTPSVVAATGETTIHNLCHFMCYCRF